MATSPVWLANKTKPSLYIVLHVSCMFVVVGSIYIKEDVEDTVEWEYRYLI